MINNNNTYNNTKSNNINKYNIGDYIYINDIDTINYVV